MESNGWIRIHRKVLDNPIVCKDAEHLAIWLWILLNVTHKDADVVFNGKRTTLHPGQICTTTIEVAERLSISRMKVRRVLSDFEDDKQIETLVSNKNRIITVKNWRKYQISDKSGDTQKKSEIASGTRDLEHQLKEGDTQPTLNRHSK